MNIRNQLAFGGKTIPTSYDAFVLLDGTISGSNFVDKISGRLFPIVNKDFPTGWVKGFPYKSAATFSAPVGDTELIAKDVDGFFYTAGVPNQIPVNACFQDVDYAHRLFFRHIGQSVDIDTYAETYEPRVAEMVLYNTAATGGDLTVRNAYFNVPAKLTSGFRVVDPVNGSDSGNGTDASPWKTLTKAETSSTLLDTIYVKSGVTTEATYWYPRKTLTYKAIGNVTVKSVSTTYVCLCETPDNYTIDGFTFDGEANTTNVIITYKNAKFNRCRFVNPKNTSGGVLATVQTGNPTFKNSIFAGGFTNGYILPKRSLEFDTCFISANITPTVDVVSTANNCRLIGAGSSSQRFISASVPFSFTVNGGNMVCDGLYAFAHGAFAFSATNNISIKHAAIDIENVSVAFLHTTVGGWNNIVIEDCVVDNKSTKSLVVSVGNGSFEAKNMILSSKQASGIYYSKYGNELATATVERISNDVSSLATGYAVGIGTEAASAGSNTLTSVIITETASYGPNYDNSASLAPHGVFVGFQAGDVNVNYNRNIGVGSSYVFKGDNTDYAVSDCGYNLSINDFIGLVLSGSKNVFTHNKTIINPKQKAFILYANVGSNGSTGATVKNCIAISPSVILWDIDTYSLSGLTADYNIYYCPLEKPFVVAGVAKTFAEWQSLGYDTHSVMLSSLAEAKALFVDYDNMNFALPANSAAIGFGQNLGEPHNVGLDASTNWGSETQMPNVITKQQPVLWDCGAYIH